MGKDFVRIAVPYIVHIIFRVIMSRYTQNDNDIETLAEQMIRARDQDEKPFALLMGAGC